MAGALMPICMASATSAMIKMPVQLHVPVRSSR
jgi:hypothetical protein